MLSRLQSSHSWTGEGFLSSLLVWELTRFSSSWDVSMRVSVLHWLWWDSPLVPWLVGIFLGSHNMADGSSRVSKKRQKENKCMRDGNHRIPVWFQKWHPIAFAIFYLLKTSGSVEPTLKGEIYSRVWISAGGDPWEQI